MSYIGNTPFTAAFLVDTFSGNGSTVAFTMSVAPANTSSVLVSITGVVQDPSTYSVSGTTLTFSAAPPSGTSNISVRYLGIPASGVTTTAYRTQTEFTATAGQTTFTVPSYTVGYIDVYRNGLLLGSADFTATTGTTVVLANAASAGDFIETVSFYVSSVLNALPQTGGTLSGNLAIQGAETLTGAVATNGASFSGASLVAGRVDSSNEGGQVDLCRAFDNASAWAIDVFGNTSTPTLRFVDNIAAAARMVIDGSGNVGVGCTSLVGSGSVSIKGGQSLQWQAAGASTVYGDIYTDTSNNMVFRTGSSPTERMRIDSSGLVGIGTTTAASYGMYLKTTVNGGYLHYKNADFVWATIAGGSPTTGFSTANACSWVSKDSSTSRSINAAGTVNTNGADYAEYMTKAGNFVIAKGDVVGINAEGKLTNVFADSVSFAVKSTDPSFVGGDNWFEEEAPKAEDGTMQLEGEAWDAYKLREEAARQLVDRIAFAGQVPVNVTGATAGQYIIPVNDNGVIKGQAVSNPTFEQYQQAVGKVIAIEQDGRARIIVKVA